MPLCAFNQKSLDLSRILRLTSNCPPVPVHCASIDDKDSDHFHVKSQVINTYHQLKTWPTDEAVASYRDRLSNSKNDF